MPAPRSRKKKSHHIPRGLAIIIVIVVVAAVLFFSLHGGSWRHFRTDLFGRHSHSAIVNRPCLQPLPTLSGGAVAASRAAKFATVEQLDQLDQLNSSPGEAQRRVGATGPQPGASLSGTRGKAALGPAPNSAPVYRVQARLLGLQQQGNEVRLELGSLVNPKLTLYAYIPATGCGATQEDTALYEELREVVDLQFGPIKSTLTSPSQPTRVVAIGALVAGA
ncbi:MAG: hypothetical protein ACRD0Y_13480, partial [Terriglobales bacterium]